MTETTQPPLLSTGRTWQEMPVGLAFRTPGRTMTETDLVNFLGLSLYTEPLFLEANHAAEGGYSGRLIPGGLTFIVAEGLVQQTNVLHGTGLAFMHSDLDIRKPVYVGDTIYVEVEVTGSRASSRPGRGVVTARNLVRNQHGDVVMEYNPVRMIRGDDFG
jgi:acyl dehydratase